MTITKIDNKRIKETIEKATNSFEYFVNNIFCHSYAILKDKKFVSGKHVDNICNYLQYNERTMRISARDHFKSMSLYAHFMWKLFCSFSQDLEVHYFSYNFGMASYHTGKIKHAIQSNPFFNDITDLKRGAESVLKFTWDGKHIITLEPHGLTEFKRGIHCPLLYVDDPFQDPDSKLLLNKIYKINRVIKTEILDMSWREIHIAGTPQTNDDFFFDKGLIKNFNSVNQPAIVNEKQNIPLWEEWCNWDDLMRKKEEKGERIFNQEYLCNPAYSEDSFIKKNKLLECINNDLPNLDIGKEIEIDGDVIGGWDIGKKVHPAHFSVFKRIKNKWIQIHQKFMDKWDYNEQKEYVEMAIDNLGIDSCYYDATRGELESFAESGNLHPALIPINFTVKSKHKMAVAFEKLIINNEIELLNDKRMINQILNVDSDLKSVEMPDGHGDSFWSIGLCFNHLESEGLDITFI